MDARSRALMRRRVLTPCPETEARKRTPPARVHRGDRCDEDRTPYRLFAPFAILARAYPRCLHLSADGERTQSRLVSRTMALGLRWHWSGSLFSTLLPELGATQVTNILSCRQAQ